MLFIRYYRNINETDPVLINPSYVEYIEPEGEDEQVIHMASGREVRVRGGGEMDGIYIDEGGWE